MHYCIHLITKNCPSDSEIKKILNPYKWETVCPEENPETGECEDFEYPAFTWDWLQVGGRYKGSLKLKIDFNDPKYDWEHYSNNPKAGRLFRSTTIEKISQLYADLNKSLLFYEEDYFYSMGARDKYLYVDGAYVKDIINIEHEWNLCYGIVDVDGSAIVRDWWNGTKWIENKNFENESKELFGKRQDCFITVIDIHD